MKDVLFLRAHDRDVQVNVMHPLGALFLAARLREACPGRFRLRVLHAGIPEDPVRTLKEWLAEFPPDYLVMTVMTVEIPFMRSLIRIVKRAVPHCRILVGGPYPSSMPDHAARQPHVDAVGIGEGEETLVDLLTSLEAGTPLADVPGIAFLDGRDVVRTAPRPYIEDLDALPMAAWDLIDLEPYRRVVNMSSSLRGRNFASLFTSRGCPYRCIYCHSIQGKRFRARSPKPVLEEMRWLYEEHGIDEFQIMDDIFNFDRQRMHEICRGIIDSGMKIHLSFPNGIRTDRLKREDIDILEAAGTYKLCFAIESRSERIQRAVRKNNLFPKIDPIIRYTARSRIIAHSFFMVGFPTETREEVEETIDYAVHSDLDAALFFQVVPYPGTELHEWARREGSPMADVFSFNPEDFHFMSGHSATTELPHHELTRMILAGYLRFYFRPARLGRLVRKIRGWGHWTSFLRHLSNMFGLYLRDCLHAESESTARRIRYPDVL